MKVRTSDNAIAIQKYQTFMHAIERARFMLALEQVRLAGGKRVG